MQSRQPQPHDDIQLALAAVSRAIAAVEAVEHEAYSDAAQQARITAYGNHCARRVLLQQAKSILGLLARSLSTAGVLGAD